MAGLKDIRTRIASVKTTRQVTNAMKMVSAAKLKKAQDAIVHFRPYAQKLNDILAHLVSSSDNRIDSPFCEMRKPQKILIVAIASNRGLCGSFNLNIAKEVVELINTKYRKQNKAQNVHVMAIGRQCEQLLKSMGIKPVADKNELWHNFNYAETEKIAEEIMADFTAQKYDRIELVFNEFSSAAKQVPTCMEFIPVALEQEKEKPLEHHDIMIYEPSKEEILKELMPAVLKMGFYRVLLDSNTAEHGARMTSMHIATDNATDLINELTLHYNKVRQAAITKEIVEISGASNAMQG